jgi:hypothetical protein
LKKKWSAQEIERLKAEYPHIDTSELALAMGRTRSSVHNMSQLLGLKKSDKRIAEVSAKRIDRLISLEMHRFEPGHKTWNKGKKMPGHGNPKTHFKPGGTPYNLCAIGSTRIDKDGCLVVKVSATGIKQKDWVSAHVLAWVKERGDIPTGRIVVFKKGMKTAKIDEITVDRLECIDRRELMRRNSLHNKYTPEIAKLQQLRGVLTRQINKKAKEQRA